MDHAGTTIYAKSVINEFAKEMKTGLYGNPHSGSPSSMLSTLRTERVRSRLLQFFKADPNCFDIIFVANATAAIKLVMDSFRDYTCHNSQEEILGFWYGYHRDSHTSLVGVREVAQHGARCFETDQEVEDWIESSSSARGVDSAKSPSAPSLFAFPAQSNLNGHRLPLSWSGRLRNMSNEKHPRLYTLLDAAAFATTAQIDLSDHEKAPDFITLSFYKIFGFPDLGALIVRKGAQDMLQHRRFFGGGTVDIVTSIQDQWFVRKEGQLHESFEDGTIPFHSIIALDSAMSAHERLYGSMNQISRHTCSLAKHLFEELSSLRHMNGELVCFIYKNEDSEYGDSKTQAPILAFNVQDWKGSWIGKTEFERMAIKRNIQLRTGGMCNPGGIATSLRLSAAEMRRNYHEGVRCGNEVDVIEQKPTGVIRASLGAMTTMKDVKALIEFVKEEIVQQQYISEAAQMRAFLPTVGYVSHPRNDFMFDTGQSLASTLTPLSVPELLKTAAILTTNASDKENKTRSRWRHRFRMRVMA